MTVAHAVDSGVGQVGGGGEDAPEHPADRPENPLCAEGSSTISKGEAEVEEDLSIPLDREERSCGWIQQQVPIPPTEINLKHGELLAGVPGLVPLDHSDDVIGCGK